MRDADTRSIRTGHPADNTPPASSRVSCVLACRAAGLLRSNLTGVLWLVDWTRLWQGRP